MKNLFCPLRIAVLVLVAFHIGGCSEKDIIATYDLTGEWRVVSYKISSVIKKNGENTWSQYNNGDVTVRFTETDLSGGKISGIKVTNSFSGDYTIDNKGGITISNLLQTFITEPEWARLFDSIGNAESYVVRGNRLVIYFNQGMNNITLEKLK